MKRVQIDRAGSIHTELVLVTPEMAAEWLTKNFKGNRAVIRRRVERWKAELVSDRWALTHQGIAFAPDGELLDGQHRLMAIVETGIAVKMLVTHGVEKSAFTAIDQGKSRSFADALRRDQRYTSMVRTLAALELGIIDPKNVSVTEAQECLVRNEVDTDRIAREVGASKYTPGTILGVLAFALPVNPEAVIRFGLQIRDGEMLERHDPAYALRGWLDRNGVTKQVPTILGTLSALRYGIVGMSLASIFTGESGYRAICTARRARNIGFTPPASEVETMAMVPSDAMEGRRHNGRPNGAGACTTNGVEESRRRAEHY